MITRWPSVRAKSSRLLPDRFETSGRCGVPHSYDVDVNRDTCHELLVSIGFLLDTWRPVINEDTRQANTTADDYNLTDGIGHLVLPPYVDRTVHPDEVIVSMGFVWTVPKENLHRTQIPCPLI